MYVYRHNNVRMSIDMVIENSELKSAIPFLTNEASLFANWRDRNAQECAMRLSESQRDNPICHGRKLSIFLVSGDLRARMMRRCT